MHELIALTFCLFCINFDRAMKILVESNEDRLLIIQHGGLPLLHDVSLIFCPFCLSVSQHIN